MKEKILNLYLTIFYIIVVLVIVVSIQLLMGKNSIFLPLNNILEPENSNTDNQNNTNNNSKSESSSTDNQQKPENNNTNNDSKSESSNTDNQQKPENNSTNNDSKSESSNTDNQQKPQSNYSEDIKITGISLDKTSISLDFNKSVKLIASIKPLNATNKNVKWTSSDLSLVSVDNNGNITAVGNKNGKATITVTTIDGNYKASCIVAVNAVYNSTPSVSTVSTDRIIFESLSSGNSILLQSNNDFMLIDAGKGDDSCTSLVTDIKKRIGNNRIKYAMLSHLHSDHMDCLNSILENVVIENFIIKDYTKYTYDSKIKNKYELVLQVLKKKGIKIYQIYDKNFSSTSKDGHDFAFKGIDEISKSCTEDVCTKKYDNNLSFVVNKKDLNRSRISLSLGNFNLKLFNIPLRNESENLNSISVYGTIDGYKFYIANDLTNSSVTVDSIKYENYGNTTSLVAHNRFMPARLADYYAWFVNKYFSNGSVDLYQAGHHGYSNGTTTYMANLLIDKKTKIVFTNSANRLYSSINEWKKNTNTLLIDSIYKNNKICSGLSSDKDDYHRCLNDYTIARILYVLKSKGTTKTGIYHLSNNLNSNEKTLVFGFNNPSASRITVSGGEYITYNYNSKYDKYALYK